MGFIYNEAGSCLASLLRMEEAVQVAQQPWVVEVERQHLGSAGVSANTLSFHLLSPDWRTDCERYGCEVVVSNNGIGISEVPVWSGVVSLVRFERPVTRVWSL